MMGLTKLSKIRSEVPKGFKMSDTELLAGSDRQSEELGRKPKASASTIDTLRWLRNALVKKAKRDGARRKRPRAMGRSKS